MRVWYCSEPMHTYTCSRFLIGMSLLLISGCAVTIKEFREAPLMVLAKVAGRHEAMANCMMLRLEEALDTWPDTFRLTTEGNRTSLLISRSPSGPFIFTPSPLVEMVFTEAKPKDLLIESRSRPSLNAEYYLDQARQLIAVCGKQSVSS